LRFGTRNVRSLYSSGALTSVARELVGYKFDLVGVQEVRWDRGGTARAAVPLEAWSGPEDSRKLRFPDFMTTAQDGGMVVRLTDRPPLPPRNTLGTHFC
jgi:hypothetical protein